MLATAASPAAAQSSGDKAILQGAAIAELLVIDFLQRALRSDADLDEDVTREVLNDEKKHYRTIASALKDPPTSIDTSFPDGTFDSAESIAMLGFTLDSAFTRFYITLAALGAGKDVVVEKPAFLSTAEFDTALATQEASGRRLLVAENYFYKPLRAKLEGLIRGGAVGRPLFLSVDATKRQAAEGWRGDPAAGGGPLLEGGVHWIDLMANAGLRVTGARGVPMGEDPVAGRSVLATFAYAGGAAGELRFSWDSHAVLGGVRLSHLHGTEGTLTFESNGAFLVARGRRRAVWLPRPADASGARPMWRDFLAALRHERAAAFTPAYARRDIELVEQIRASLAQPDG